MRRYRVRLLGDAEQDLFSIYQFLRDRSGSPLVAQRYVQRILAFLQELENFPERGSLRNDVRPGLHVIGFERRVSIAFVVEDEMVVVLRIGYAGRQLDLNEHQ